VSFLKARTIKI
ncbi:hypothetical protein VCHC55C2_3216B, partial [Vibrio cholerae HC-55C2]